jgi:hypothetical protein
MTGVHNADTIVLPDTIPARVICEGIVFKDGRFPCDNVGVFCSANASCDVVVTANSGLGKLSVFCGNSSHSCNVFCDNLSSISDWRCNSTSACNCASNCATDRRIVPGINAIGDECYGKIPDPCLQYQSSLTMRPAIVDGNCSCECINTNYVRYLFGSNYGCADPALVCFQDSDCGTWFQGSCPTTPPQHCQCNNPWGGPRCQQHMCPQCKNSAYCSISATSPCVCTGQWMGTYCDVPKPITAGRPDIPDNAARVQCIHILDVAIFPTIISRFKLSKRMQRLRHR